MWFTKNQNIFLSKEAIEQLTVCIREQERATTGEIRLFIESRCPYMDPVRRAAEVFSQLHMQQTSERNGVLIYIAHRDKDFALFADSAFYAKLDPHFLRQESKRLAHHFQHHDYERGVRECIEAVGKQLSLHFPWHGEKKNELPDEIIFGR